MKRYSNETKSRAVNLGNKGETTLEVANIIGCSTSSVRRWIKEANRNINGGE